MLVVDGVIVEKDMTYKMLWDLEAMEKEERKGADGVSYKHWEKGGLSVRKSYYGTYIVGLMFTLDYALVTNAKVKCETLQDELDYDIAFPMVNVRKLTMEDGCSSKQNQNPEASSIMHERIVDALKTFKKEGKELVSVVDGKELSRKKLSSIDGKELADGKRKAEEVVQCEVCGEMPCVWVTERDRVIANDKIVHGHLLTVENRTRRKIAFRHMFHVTNGGYGETGVRQRHFECVEEGVRSLFQDVEYMGFKEE
jgi:hypothetical protein